MKKIITAVYLLHSLYSLTAQDTFSIVAADSVTGEVGSAGASCINGSIIISDVHPGFGVVHTQSYWLNANQNYAEGLMDQGLSAQQIIDSVVANDAQGDPTIRQYGAVDFNGAAAYTGINCLDYKNHIVGPTYSIQGNILLGQEILDSMEARFLNTQGTLACKLMAALQGANVPGADSRCLDEGLSSLSAFIRVALPGDLVTDLALDLNVYSVPNDWSVDPIDSLQILFDQANGCNPLSNDDLTTSSLAIKVYPNPSHGDATIISTHPIRNIYLIENGSEELLASDVGSKSYRLQTKSWSSGMKILKVELENGQSEMIKVMIQ